MRPILFIVILCLLVTEEIIAQEGYPMQFNDSIEVFHSPYIVTNRPDTFKGDTVYRLTTPEVFILLNENGENSSLLVFVKHKKKWRVFTESSYSKETSYSFDTIDFNGKSNPELLIRWSEENYEQGARGYTIERNGGIDLWDIDNLTLIFSIHDKDEFESSWYTLVYDSTEQDLVSVDVSESYCSNYITSFENNTIAIWCDPNCVERNDIGNPLPQFLNKYFYKLSGDYLVRTSPPGEPPLGDTILSVYAEFRFYTSLDSIQGDTVFQFDHPQGFIMKQYVNYDAKILVVLPAKGGFKVFDAAADVTASEFTFEQIDFDGKGYPELIIRWSYYWGHTGFSGGIHEEMSGIMIWRLEDACLLFSMQTRWVNETWWQDWSFMTKTDSITGEETTEIVYGDSDGESFCDNWIVSISKKQVKITSDTECLPPEDYQTHSPYDSNTYVYQLRPCGLVLKK